MFEQLGIVRYCEVGHLGACSYDLWRNFLKLTFFIKDMHLISKKAYKMKMIC